MRATNGRYINRLPTDAATKAGAIGKSVGGAALQAVLMVTAVRLVDFAFSAIANRTKARRAREPEHEPVGV